MCRYSEADLSAAPPLNIDAQPIAHQRKEEVCQRQYKNVLAKCKDGCTKG